jgi:hypothetical protein
MNGWDLFTWFNAAVLAVAAVTIFSFFLRDARGILIGQQGSDDDEQIDVLADTDSERLAGVPANAAETPDPS